MMEELDVLLMKCSLTLNGDWMPVVQWKQIGGADGSNLRQDVISNNTSITSLLTLNLSSSSNGASFICKTYFDQAGMSLPNGANNIPNYTFNWKSQILNVSCEYYTKNLIKTLELFQKNEILMEFRCR